MRGALVRLNAFGWGVVLGVVAKVAYDADREVKALRHAYSAMSASAKAASR